jgi:hypothetical protein
MVGDDRISPIEHNEKDLESGTHQTKPIYERVSTASSLSLFAGALDSQLPVSARSKRQS